jgi:programmed cell death protein 4
MQVSVYCDAGVRVVLVKQSKIKLLLEDFEAGGELAETCQCIRDLDMPFFHHEVVKKVLVTAMEKKTTMSSHFCANVLRKE